MMISKRTLLVKAKDRKLRGVKLIVYREAQTSELPEIAKLYNMLAFELKAVTKDCYFDFEILSEELVLRELKQSVQKNKIKIYIAIENNDVIGFIAGTIMSCFLSISSINKVGYIDAAFVMASYRNRNIMRNLEELITEHFRKQGMKFVELNVLTENICGKQFWKKYNYETFREQMRKQL